MNQKPSWLTTLFGILSGAGTAAAHYGSGTIGQLGMIVSAISVTLLGVFAQDSSSSSAK